MSQPSRLRDKSHVASPCEYSISENTETAACEKPDPESDTKGVISGGQQEVKSHAHLDAKDTKSLN
jgi:hypothetical protein